ncbi:hypothetical protein RhiirA4_464272 [Rhizophagus irregularis]|uniref:Uncharacterized protein n=1 Tax=Rhizophagus irregularis TaxID=588596 RepID=A0A2I1GPP8_9GLOM|nr:hypothetical protein RhiirA4_464272 [Rhizophagus irregularis]
MTDSSSLTPTSHDDDSFNILSNVDTIEESNENIPCNDFQIYHVVCKEKTSGEIVSRLLNNCLYSSHYLFSNDLFVFYFQQPNDKRIYQIACEMVPHSFILQYLNLNIYGIEIKQDEHRQQQQQRHQEFSERHKENLEFHLKQFLFDYLTPKEDNFIDKNN